MKRNSFVQFHVFVCHRWSTGLPNGWISRCRGNQILLWLRGRQLNSGPIPMHPYWFENAIYFLRYQKNSRPLGAFSDRLHPSTRLRWIDLKTTTYPTAHAWPIRVKGQKTLNKFLILRGVDWNLQCDLSVVFVCPHVHAKTAFSRSSVFIDRFHRIRVDVFKWKGIRVSCF